MRSVSDKKPPGDIERLLFPVYPSPEEMNNIGDSPYPYQPATPQLGMDDILKYLVSERGGDPELWRDLAYYIGFHESGPHQRMSPTARQISDGGVEGPARGTYQFEKDSFDTAKQRYRNLFSAMRDMGYKGDMDQDILEANNADELPLDKQTALLYANLIQGPAKLADYVSGDMSATDLWLQGHKLKEAEGNRERFEESMRAADEQRETYYPFVGNNLRSVDTESKPILPAENNIGGRVAGNKSGGGAESDDDTSITDGRGRVIKYKNGGRPGGFLSSNARDGWPKAHKSYYPFSGRDVTVEDGVTTVENRQGYDSGMKEMLELIRMGSGGSRRQISLPTGREYKDTDLMRTTTRYAGDDFIDQKSARYKLHKDDKAKTFDQYKGVKTPKGSKSVEIQGEDLNWLQRQFPRLFLERYKTKSKYNDEGELVKKVKVSRAGGREVKKYPTSAELDAIIEQDIKAAQAQDNTNASGGRVVKYKHGGRHDDPPNYSLGKQVLDYLAGYGQARPQENNRFDATLQDMADFFMSRQGQELGTEPKRRYVSGEGFVPAPSEREDFESMLGRTMITNDKGEARKYTRMMQEYLDERAEDAEQRSFVVPGAVDKETGERVTRSEYLRRQEEGNAFDTTLSAPIVYNYLSENPSARGVAAEEFYHAVQTANNAAKGSILDDITNKGTSEAINELMEMNYYNSKYPHGLLHDGTTFDTLNLYQANEPRDNSDKGFYDGVHRKSSGEDARWGMNLYYLGEDQGEGDAAINSGIYFAREMGILPEGEITAQDLPEILERFKGYTATQPGRTEFDLEKLKEWKPDGRKIVKIGKDGKVILTKYGQKWMQDDENKLRFRERTMTKGEGKEARLDNRYMRMLEDIITDAANQQGIFDPTNMNPSIAREGYERSLNSGYTKDYKRRSPDHPANRFSSGKMPIDLLLDILNTGGGRSKSYRERSAEMDLLRGKSERARKEYDIIMEQIYGRPIVTPPISFSKGGRVSNN
jgi:hypothetical protein